MAMLPRAFPYQGDHRSRSNSLSSFLCFFTIAFLSVLAQAETLERVFHVGWAYANPDGQYRRAVIAINGAWPPPLIRGAIGDDLVLTVHNELGNASTSVHFHGFFQNGTNHMDGAVGVTQCAIPPGQSFVYRIRLSQPGTYWYHAHNNGQYLDGLRGMIVVHDPLGPYEDQYDAEIVLSLSDWYHELSPQLLADFINVENPTGAEPVPQAALINDTQNLRIPVASTTDGAPSTYLMRLANIGGFASHYFWVEGHTMQIVEVDGVWTHPAPAERLYITPAQRYSVLIKRKDDGDASTTKNFAIVSAMDQDLFDVIPSDLQANVTGWLVYDDNEALPQPMMLKKGRVDDDDDEDDEDDEDDDDDDWGAFDDMVLVPVDGQSLLEDFDLRITLSVTMDNLGDGANYAFFNGKTYVQPKVPSLYTALTVGAANASNSRVYGSYTLPYVLPHLAVVEIVINNEDDGAHPFHLHGHNFQVIYRSAEGAGSYGMEDAGSSVDDAEFVPVSVPMRRDTVYVRPNGYVVLRFRADNPGMWLFHCHIEWHMDQGLIATMIEAPEVLLQNDLPNLDAIPPDHLLACRAAGAPTSGNAAGNVHDVLDLRGQNRPSPPLPSGFTAKGYVALFFSVVAAILGMAVISWYGVLDASSSSRESGGIAGAESQPLVSEDENEQGQ